MPSRYLIQLFTIVSLIISYTYCLPLLPVIDFNNNPADQNKIICLTFDDGIDREDSTMRILDTLDANGIKSTFFLNAYSFTYINEDARAQGIIRDIVNRGHQIGSHTARHLALSQPDVDVRKELTELQDLINQIVPGGYQFTVGRAPFGDPYNALGTPETRARVNSIFGQYMMHIGWSIDSGDFSCNNDPNCVYNNTMAQIDQGRWGIILMHNVWKHTADVLPRVITELKRRGFTFVDLETIIKLKYGFTSKEMYTKYRIEGTRVPNDIQSNRIQPDSDNLSPGQQPPNSSTNTPPVTSTTGSYTNPNPPPSNNDHTHASTGPNSDGSIDGGNKFIDHSSSFNNYHINFALIVLVMSLAVLVLQQ